MKLKIHYDDLPSDGKPLYIVQGFDKFGPYNSYHPTKEEASESWLETPGSKIYVYNGSLVEIEVEECPTT